MRISWVAVMFGLGIAIPGFIMYTIFSPNPVPQMPPLPGFDGYQRAILERSSSGYVVDQVIDENLVLRINAIVDDVPEDRLAKRIQATNILYDIQSVVGKEVSVGVWTYRTRPANRANMIGLIYFHALTAIQIFKTPDELE